MNTTGGLAVARGIAKGTGWAVAIGVAMYVVAYGWLLVVGDGMVTPSSDPGAPSISLWAAAIPALAAILLARLVAPRHEPPAAPRQDVPHQQLVRETWILVLCAIVFPVLVYGNTQSLWYPLVKVLLLLVLPLVAFRMLRRGAPATRAIPKAVIWLAPLPAFGVWFVLSEIWPYAQPLPEQLPDPITLAISSLLTLLTASVLEEIFYRGWLQTRLETRYGRWPAILGSSLLFAFMHLGRVQPDAIGLGLAGIVSYQGMFGLMLGYLWSRYRNIWIVIAIHVVVNLGYVDMLVAAVRG